MLTRTIAQTRITVARRRCAGCRRTTALNLWPWKGRVLVTTHGLCRRCLRSINERHLQQLPRFDAQERAVVSELLN